METVLHVLDTENNRTAQERGYKKERVSLRLIPSLQQHPSPTIRLPQMKARGMSNSIVARSLAGCPGGYHVGLGARCLVGYALQDTEPSYGLLEEPSHSSAGQGHRDQGCLEHGFFLDHHVVHGWSHDYRDA